MREPVMWGVLLLLVAATSGCAALSDRRAGDAEDTFSGAWSVPWCDTTDPELECGGFAITLIQQGNRICGDFTGALVNLRQVDDGGITGSADGGVAMLAVRSGRSDAIVQVRATRIGRNLHWKQTGLIREGGSDIDVIALDDLLTPAAENRPLLPETCTAQGL